MAELLLEVNYSRQEQLIVIPDNAKVQENEQATPVHPILETLNCSDSFRELFKANGGNTRWSGGSSTGGNNSFRLSVSSPLLQTPVHAACSSHNHNGTPSAETGVDNEGSSSSNLSLASTSSSQLCTVGSKKIDGRWESATPSPAARSRNAAASLALPRRLPEHTDSFQIISKSIRRGGIRVPTSFGRQGTSNCVKNGQKTRARSRNNKGTNDTTSEGDDQCDMPSLTDYLAEPTPVTSSYDDDGSIASNDSSSSSQSSSGLSRDDTLRLSFAAHAFQEVERRYSAQSNIRALPAAAMGHQSCVIPRRCSSMPLTVSSPSGRSCSGRRSKQVSKSRGRSSSFEDDSALGHAQQETVLELCDQVARFVSDPNSGFDNPKGKEIHNPPAPATRRMNASFGLSGVTNESNSTIRPQPTADERLNISPHSTIVSSHSRHNNRGNELQRPKSDILDFRNSNTSAYFYAPQLHSLSELKQQNMGKIERRSVVDNSLAFFGTDNPSTERGNGGGGTSPASRKHNHHKELLHDRWAPTEKNHLAAVLEQIRVQRKPSGLREVECSKRRPLVATDNPLASNTCN